MVARHGTGPAALAGLLAGAMIGLASGLYVDLIDTEFEGIVAGDQNAWTLLGAGLILVLLAGAVAAGPLRSLGVPPRRAWTSGVLAHLAAVLLSNVLGLVAFALGLFLEGVPLHPLILFLVLGATFSVAGGARLPPWPFAGIGLLLLVAATVAVAAVAAALPANSPLVWIGGFLAAGLVVWGGVALLGASLVRSNAPLRRADRDP
jgi:hypothetical protein